jgi:nucleotide-binding universal stress UspA family protein
MLVFLLPVDGSETSNQAVAKFINLLDWYKEKPQLHLLNVQFPQRGNVSLFIDKESLDQYHQEEGLKALESSRKLLASAGIDCEFHILVGSPEEMIVRYAQEMGCDQIIMGPRGLGIVKGLFLGSVANKVMELSAIPVLLVK